MFKDQIDIAGTVFYLEGCYNNVKDAEYRKQQSELNGKTARLCCDPESGQWAVYSR